LCYDFAIAGVSTNFNSPHQNTFITMIQAISLRRGRRILFWFVSSLGLVLLLALPQLPARAQINQAVIQEILDGDRVFIEETLATVDAIADFQQKVSTEEARTSLLFSNGSVGRLGPNSEITIGQCIEVKQGLLLASGPANGCTANFQIGVQGTIYVVEVDELGESQVKVLEGEVEVLTDPDRDPVRVSQGKRLNITPEGRVGEPLLLSQADIEAILKGVLFNGFKLELPGMANLQDALRSLYPDINLPNLPGFNLPIRQPSRPSLPGLPF
jgi:hypothetical protein